MTKKHSNIKTYFFATFYHFTGIEDVEGLRSDLIRLGQDIGIIGIVLLADEGLNSTVAGDEPAVREFIDFIIRRDGFAEMDVKYSKADLARIPFRKLKVRIKKEIVTMGVEGIDVASGAGEYIEPEDWDELIRDPDVLLIDTRNVYEYRLGTFEGAVDPRTLNFRQFPDTVKKMIGERKPSKVAMFCTGGIRCEKATAYVKQLGVEQVYHLHGGILKYLETIPRDESSWKGKCFVFDGRITVNHELGAEPEPLCKKCGQVMLKDPQSGEYRCFQCEEYPLSAQV